MGLQLVTSRPDCRSIFVKSVSAFEKQVKGMSTTIQKVTPGYIFLFSVSFFPPFFNMHIKILYKKSSSNAIQRDSSGRPLVLPLTGSMLHVASILEIVVVNYSYRCKYLYNYLCRATVCLSSI